MDRDKFCDRLRSGDFLVTAELGPPKGVDTERMVEDIKLMRDRVDAINVTDNQSSVMRMASLGACVIIRQNGGEPILQITFRDRNRIAIQSDLLAASALGIDNVLCLTGDHPKMGDHPDAKGVFDFGSIHLIQTVRALEGGHDVAGNELSKPPEFCCGAVVTPGAEPLELQLLKFRKKIEAGVDFVQTQAIYDIDKFKGFMEQVREITDTKIFAGILLLTSPGMAKFVDSHIPGVNIPAELIEELKSSPKGTRLKKGIEIAARLIKRLKDEEVCDGVHIMAIGKEHVVPEILDRSGL